MTDQTDYRRVKETDALAKSLGFKISYSPGRLLVYTNKTGLPSVLFGQQVKVFDASDLIEVRGFLKGFDSFRRAMNVVEFDEEEYKKRLEDKNVLDLLKGKKIK